MKSLKSFALFVVLGLASVVLADEGNLPTVRVPSVVKTADKTLAPWVWLDAADKANFEFDDAGQVTKWLDSGVLQHNAVPSNRRWIGTDGVATREMRYGMRSITNGVPAYCMGDLYSGIDLEFARCAAIRTVFWVGDLARCAFLLGDRDYRKYDFHRQGLAELTGNDKTDYGLFHSAYALFTQTTSEVRMDGETVSYNVPVKPGARHVIVADVGSGAPATACLLSDDRPVSGGGSDRTGGRALSELIVFTNRLSATEVAKVENYLLAKWQGTTVDVSAEVAVGGGVIYPHVTVGVGAAFAYSGASLATDEPAVEIMGALSKNDGAKLVISYAGTGIDLSSFRGARPLLVCAESSLTADDFALQGFPEGTELDWTGTTLSVRIAAIENELIPAALTATDSATAPWVWYDAADQANFLFNESGNVANWMDRGARHQNATPSTQCRTGTTAKLGTWEITNGVPAYCMGDLLSGIDLEFPRCEQIRTVFWVGDLARRAFLLGDTNGKKYDFHRQGGVDLTGNDNTDYGLFHREYARFQPTTSEVRIDGVKATVANEPVKPGARHVIVADTLDGTPATACLLSDDRPLTGGSDRSGGRALSELVVFTNRLSALDVAYVESYLRAKWLNAEERLAETVDVTAGVVYPNLVLADGAVFALDGEALAEASACKTPRVTVYGLLRKETAEKVVIRWTKPPHRAMVLMRCQAATGLDLSDFRMEGAADWRLAWDGTALSLVPRKGILFILR